MPRGVPAAGFRNRAASSASRTKVARIQSVLETALVPEQAAPETDAEIETRIDERFEILEDLTAAAITGDVRAVIVSGPAGLGKSFTVEERLKRWDPQAERHTIVKGYVKATGLLKLLYQHAAKGRVLVFDDADTVFFDDTALNMLKAVCDSSKKRTVSYLAEGSLFDEDTGAKLPKKFDFEGTIIFITNLDFDAMIQKGHKLAPHLAAMMSRAHYIDLAMKTRRDYMIRIKSALKKGLLSDSNLSETEQTEVIAFLDYNQDTLRELSLRMALKIADMRKVGGARWEKLAKVTCCK